MSETVKIGAREIKFDLNTLMRIEQGTGMECGAILNKCCPSAAEAKRLAELDEEQQIQRRTEMAMRLAGVEFAVKFVAATANVPTEVVVSDHSKDLLKVFVSLIEPFATAVTEIMGVTRDDEDDEEEDESTPSDSAPVD